MYTKEQAFSHIAALVERFTEQLPSYKNNGYNEMLTHRDFIDPFFKALGWDMNNSSAITKKSLTRYLPYKYLKYCQILIAILIPAPHAPGWQTTHAHYNQRLRY
mgnify:CR=1 FL=1